MTAATVLQHAKFWADAWRREETDAIQNGQLGIARECRQKAAAIEEFAKAVAMHDLARVAS